MESKIDFIKKHFSLFIAFVCLSLFSFNFWLFYPGYITYDWGRVLSSFTLDNWRPVFHPWVLKKISDILGYHIYYPLLFNLIPFYLGIYIITLGLWKRFHSMYCFLGMLPIFIADIFFNNIVMHSSYSSPMFVFLTWSVVLYQILVRITYTNLVVFCVTFVLALLSRQNALIQVYPVFFVYSLILIKKLNKSFSFFKYILYLSIFAIITIAISVGFPELIKQKQSYPTNHTFLHQIAGACVPNEDETCFQKEWYKEGKSFSDVKKEYLIDPLFADRMHHAPNPPFISGKKLPGLGRAWIQSIIKYPYHYFLHIERFRQEMWYKDSLQYVDLNTRNHCLAKKSYDWLKGIYPDYELFYKSSLYKIRIYHFFKYIFVKIPTILFILLSYILFFVTGALFIKYKNIFLLYSLSSSTAGIAGSIVFCIFSPATTSRYIYPVLVSSLMAFIGIVLYFCDKQAELKLVGKEIDVKSLAQKYKKIIILAAIISFLLVIHLYLNRPVIARADVYTEYTDTPHFLLHKKGNVSPAKEASWMPKFGNRGVVVQKNGHKATIVITALEDGDITLSLRGPDERDNNGKRKEKWVKYTDFSINDKQMLSNPVEVWHDKPYRYVLKAKKGNAYKVQLKWRKK